MWDRFWRAKQLALCALAFALAALWSTVGVHRAAASFPGANGKIAFVRGLPGAREIYTMNADGSEVQEVTSNLNDSTNMEPRWSPDGTKIAFVSNHAGNSDVYVMNADGTDLTDVTNNPAADGDPAWSPDGNKIVFVSDRNGSNSLYVMNADGTGVTQLTSGSQNDSGPDWSPDGNRIVFYRWNGSAFNIYVINADGTGLTQLTSSYDLYPVWSPDGQKIAFTRSSADSSAPGIYVMNADGSNQTQIVGDTSTSGNLGAEWSPDGQKIVYWSLRNGNNNIFIANADGSGEVQITNETSNDGSSGGGAFYPDWGPQRVVPLTFVVNTTSDDTDVSPGDGACATAAGFCSLRAAVQEANAHPGADTITFAVAGTITLASGELAVSDDLTVDGPGARNLTISGGDISRIFHIEPGVTASLSGLTLTHGSAGFNQPYYWGGAVFDDHATLKLSDSTIADNHAVEGGGLFNDSGRATISGSTFTGNTSDFTGAAFQNDYETAPATATVTNSTFYANSAGSNAGGIMNSQSSLTVTNSTIVDNVSDLPGAGINSYQGYQGGAATLTNTIVADNTDPYIGGSNCQGSVGNGGGNLQYGDTTCPATYADPQLDPNGLQNNGGPTDTIAIEPGSAAIDAAVAANCPATDQRGVTRPQGAGCDIGAYERDITPPTISCGAADGSWHADNVVIACTASDAGSGLADPADASFSLTTNVPAGTEDANAATNSRQVCDGTGNCATAGPIGGNKVDRKAPSIAINAPAGTYILNQPAAATYSCTDGGSGVATCDGTAANGANVATASVGTDTFTVNASDNVANTSNDSISYIVAYKTQQVAAVSGSGTLTVAAQLYDYNNINVSAPTITLTALRIVDAAGNPVLSLDAPFSFLTKGPPGISGATYGYSASVKSLPGGTYRLQYQAGNDPTIHEVTFTR